MSTNITEHYFEFGALKYFRGNAHLVAIGTYGEKKDPVGARAYLDTEDTVSQEHLAPRVEKGRPVGVAWEQTTKAELDLNVTARGGKHGTQTITLSKGSVFAYKLHKVKDWNKDKTQILGMEADYKGMN